MVYDRKTYLEAAMSGLKSSKAHTMIISDAICNAVLFAFVFMEKNKLFEEKTLCGLVAKVKHITSV